MASSLCGPSNALSSLQKHTAADRSLQQDRLQSPSSSSQLFRTPTAHSNQLESEFSQFSTGGLPQNPRAHARITSPLNHAPRLDGWASDFQRLHIGAPVAPLLQQQQQPQGFGHSWAAANWHEEFMQRQQPTSHIAEPLRSVPSMEMYSGVFSPRLQMGGEGIFMNGGGIQAGNSAQKQNATEQFDDAAFEQAFENARTQLEKSRDNQDRQQLMEDVRETVVVEEKEEDGQEEEKEHDSDELARTAAQLLDSLSSNHSQKFQDSTFLALMRRLRDREVKVEGDKMVETVQTSGERPQVQVSNII